MSWLEDVLRALENEELQRGLRTAVKNMRTIRLETFSRFPYLTEELADYIRKTKEKVLKDLEKYVNQTLKSIEKTGAHAYLAKDGDEARKIVGEIVGDGRKIIVKSKSMVTEEIRLRQYLEERGHEVWETDLGELLIQLAKEKPMHPVGPALHMTRARCARVLKSIDPEITEDMSAEELTYRVRRFLREKFIKADVGISGANAIAADSGAVFIVTNEGNARHVTNLPPVSITVTGIEKIMPTTQDAFLQCIVQSVYLGSFPPAYISMISGPSRTGDIEARFVTGVHGPKDVHVVLIDNGRMQAAKHEYLWEQLLCVRCGYCLVECPPWNLSGNLWGGPAYGGPMGVGWTAITEGINVASSLATLCLGCGACKEVCTMKIDMPNIIRNLKKGIGH
ncbi:LUD domain-containing protein [Candidatus Methanodesulfokora washburnensis]|nr:lactate utilization protein B [Candidatus Methanodesulfokores washburnensis]